MNKVIFFIREINSNIRRVREALRTGSTLSIVVKDPLVNSNIIDLLDIDKNDLICFSSIDSASKAKVTYKNKRIIKIISNSDLCRLCDTVKHICISPNNTNINTLRKERAIKNNFIWIPVDIGDNREGVNYFEINKDMINEADGIQINFNCLNNSNNMASIALSTIEQAHKIKDDILISIGGSVLFSPDYERLMKEIKYDDFRCGEAIFTGDLPCINSGSILSNTPVVLFKSEILEIKKQVFDSNNISRRVALLDFGKIHTDTYNIKPILKKIKIIGSTTDYTMIDISEIEINLKVGDHISFRLNHDSLMRSLSSNLNIIEICHE